MDKWIEMNMISNTHFYVYTVEHHHGKEWHHDIEMNMGFNEAVQCGQRRSLFLNLPFHNRVS